MTLTLYGLPTCDTCRRARKHLDARRVPYTFVDLRAHPPGRARVAAWVGLLGSAKLRNLSGQSYRALGPERDRFTDADWIDAFTRDPMLLKRPVLELGGNPSAVGFDPGVWDALLRMAGFHEE